MATFQSLVPWRKRISDRWYADNCLEGGLCDSLLPFALHKRPVRIARPVRHRSGKVNGQQRAPFSPQKPTVRTARQTEWRFRLGCFKLREADLNGECAIAEEEKWGRFLLARRNEPGQRCAVWRAPRRPGSLPTLTESAKPWRRVARFSNIESCSMVAVLPRSCGMSATSVISLDAVPRRKSETPPWQPSGSAPLHLRAAMAAVTIRMSFARKRKDT